MFKRLINPIKSDSFFLFGARGTGKSTLLDDYLGCPSSRVFKVDLLIPEEEERFSADPGLIKKVCLKNPNYEWVIIDEVQKIPKLLDAVHSLIETKNFKTKFALTGSSARKLKKGGANLLAGRALLNNLYPLTFLELGERFELSEVLTWGALPKVINTSQLEHKNEILRAYARTYIKEEIWAEQIIKNLEPFRKFLEVAAQANTEIVNFSKIAREIGSTTHSVQNYFQILEDTLLGYFLEPFHTSVRKRVVQAPKFYFFDLGVKRALDRTLTQQVVEGTYGYGKLFEHFIVTQFVALNSYLRKDFEFFYLKTKDGLEIDLIVDRPGMPLALIEIKSSKRVDEAELSALKMFGKDFPKADLICLSRDTIAQKIGRIEALPWQQGIAKVFGI